MAPAPSPQVPPAPEPVAPVPEVQAFEEPSMPTEPQPSPLPTPSPRPEVLDLDAIITPNPDQLAPPEAMPPPVAYPTPARSPGAYNIRRPTRDIGSFGPSEPDRRRLPRPPTPVSNSAVVVQRRIMVGGGTRSSTPVPPMAPRPRRPGGGIPYVVQQGSHPDIANSRAAQQGMPPPRPLASPTDPGTAPRAIAPPPVPQELAHESTVSTRSLDDVILAYLSKGDKK